MNTLEQGVFKRLEQGSERRAELVAKAEKAETQPAASQLVAEGIVALDTTNPDTFLGRLGRAISPHTKKAALFASAVLAIISTSYWFNRSAYGDEEFSTNSAQVTTAIDQSSVSATRAEYPRISRTIYTNGGDRNLTLHQEDLSLAKQIINKTGLGFLIKEVYTFEPLPNLPPPVRDVLRPIIPRSIIPHGHVGYDPDGVRMSLNPYFGSKDIGRRTIFHELGHSVDPDLNPYLENFFSPSELTALQKVTAKLKDIYWRNYFPYDQKTLSPVEAYYRKTYTSAVGARFGGSEDLGKRLMLAYLQNPQQFKDWSQEDRDFLQKSIQFLGGEFLAENVANFALHPLESSRDFPDLTRASFKFGAVLDVAVTHRK